jgi:cellulose synthase operon protein C
MMMFLPRLRSVMLCSALGLGLALPALSQTASFEDLRALRYYLQQNDANAAQAELRRLRGAFPQWQPPANLNDLLAPQASATASVDEAEIWRRIERRDYSGARGLIDQSRGQVAGWTPPSEMLRVLELNEAQDAFDRATQSRDATAAIAVARRAPQIMSCERINNAWLLADMYVLSGQNPAAITTWRNTVQSCTSFGQMQPTLEKASAVASRAELADMFALARRANPAAQPQLDPLEARLLGGQAVASTRPAAPAPATAPRPAPVATAPVTPVAAAPVVAGSLPLRGDGRLAEVRRLKEQEQFARCLAASTAPRSLELLYERSWCAYSHQRPTEALVGFQEAARAGDAIGPNVRRDAQFGLALSYLSMNMTEQGAQAASQVVLTDTQRREIETIVLDQRGVKAFRQKDYRQAISNFNAMEQINGSLRRDLAILRAYAYLNAGQRAQALEQFERLHAQLATPDTRAGLEAARGP